MCKLADKNDYASMLAPNATRTYMKVNRDKIQKDWIEYINRMIDNIS